MLLFHKIEDGGLGLQHIKSKALAHLIATFLQTASGKIFQQSLFHSWLLRYHVEEHRELPDPGTTPYYNQQFFKIIKEVKENTPLNPVHMSVKEWYKYLLERNVVKREIDEEGRQELIPCKVEIDFPNVFWSETYRISRLHGLSPATKSFLFRLTHCLLPSKERLNHLTPATSPLCWCNSGESESYRHLFFQCSKNGLAGQALLRVIRCYDANISEDKSLRLELSAVDPFLLASVALLATGLEFIWERRKLKKSTTNSQIRAELEFSVSIRRKSRSKSIRESAGIMDNMIINFYEQLLV